MRRGIVILLVALLSVEVFADWQTHYAYTNVTQIALGKDRAWGLSDGSLFSVDKVSEAVEIWTKERGIWSTGIWMIGYDDESETLLVIYPTGEMDLIRDGKVSHLSDFAYKDMTASKRANNLTFAAGRAYLSCEFGIVSFDMRKHEFVDLYYIGPEAAEVNVEDVVIQGDSIFAFAGDKLYKASAKTNVVDYRCWSSEPMSDRIKRDTSKRQKYVDTNKDVWAAGEEEGIVRLTVTGSRLTYLPNGPATNNPYRLKYDGGRLYMVSGGRWAVQYFRPGHVMILEDGKWTNITQNYIQSKTGKTAMDFMNVAVDPRDPKHFYVTSYGTGEYEFQGSELIAHHTPANSTITAILENYPDTYTRTEGAVFDKDGNMLSVVTSHKGPVFPIRLADGTWSGINLHVNGKQLQVETPGEILIDANRPNFKMLPYCREHTALIVLDDGGTLLDESDDRCVMHNSFVDEDGKTVLPEAIYEIREASDGSKWIATTDGVIILPPDADYIESNACRRLHFGTEEDEILSTGEVLCIGFDADNHVWIGTVGHGVFVLSADGKEILAHYSGENTIMPSNTIQSLACDTKQNRMYIGTSEGLVSYSDQETRIAEEPAYEKGSEDENIDLGSMNGWTLHPAYSNVGAVTASDQDVYALSEGSLFSVNRQDESISYYDRLNGLSSTNIIFITYNRATRKLLIVYKSGMLDVLDAKGQIATMSDLFLKGETTEMSINGIVSEGELVYFAMSFGIVVVDLKRQEIRDTYYIGKEASSVDVQYIAVNNDSLYAVTEDDWYAGALKDNLIDFTHWKTRPLSNKGGIQGMASADKQLYLLQDSVLYKYSAGEWKQAVKDTMLWIRSGGDRLLAGTPKGFAEVANGKVAYLTDAYSVSDAILSNGEYWMAAGSSGAVRYAQGSFQQFQPNGPLSNMCYRLQFEGDRLMIAQGGRWAVQLDRPCDVIWYDYTPKQWSGIPADYTMWYLQHGVFDLMNYAVDPTNANHFFATSYGNGVVEFLDGVAVKLYNESNSSLRSSVADDPWQSLVRTDGAMYDKFGNLWILNGGTRAAAINIMTPQGAWYPLHLQSGAQRITLSTPGLLLQDSRYPNSKWLYDCRETTGVIVIDDNGTPFDQSDDHVMKRKQFIDQMGKVVAPNEIYCLTQDHSGLIWVGTDAGLFILESVEAFLASDACSRVVISRNDGTDLADYLLKDEHIQAICVDGGNRKWIGTANSGLYLVSADGQQTIHHFTVDNSPLPSNSILSLAIHPISGEVFIGTGDGLVSYRSDASEASENFSGIYAYPNPVRPNFGGVITIAGLMDNTVVYIIDSGGNLVCKTRSNGGIATWDAKNARGQRVATGVYTVLCNTADGQNHAVTKILVTH